MGLQIYPGRCQEGDVSEVLTQYEVCLGEAQQVKLISGGICLSRKGNLQI